MKKEDWISVKTLPEKIENNIYSHHVLVFDGITKYVAFYNYNDNEWQLAHGIVWDEDPQMINSNPTHWMSLPENP